jgi:hypothetical protein
MQARDSDTSNWIAFYDPATNQEPPKAANVQEGCGTAARSKLALILQLR